MDEVLKTERIRLKILIAVFIGLFLIIIIRLIQLKIYNYSGEEHKSAILTERGQILDVNYEKLSMSIKIYSLFCNPNEMESVEKAKIKSLSKILALSQQQIENIFQMHKTFVWLKRQVDYQTVNQVTALKIKGIHYLNEYKRFYPNGLLASHVLGIVGIDNRGLEGVELNYDPYLYADGELKKEPYNIILTLDKNIQYIVESELRKKWRETKAKSATAIIMEPHTGYILAMVNLPDFDPNQFEKYTEKVRKNKAITDIFEPGSIFKIFSAGVIYSENSIKDSDKFYCDGSVMIGDKKLSCWKKHGFLNFHEVIKQSCNVGMVKSIIKISQFQFYDYLRNFGIGNYTGIDLPGEAKGYLRKPKGMGMFSEAAISLGQEVGVTAIQLITAACSIFNGGKIMEPKVVKAIVKEDGSLYKQFEPVVVRQAISPRVAEKVEEDLIGVVQEGGTGTLAYVKDYLIAGKTGTGQIFNRRLNQYERNKVNSSFIGFFPAYKSQYAILITIHEPNVEKTEGGIVAAPVFKNIVEKIISYKAIPNLNRITTVPNESNLLFHQQEFEKTSSDKLPNLLNKNMREVVNILKLYNVKINLIGTGISYKQSPEPGIALKKSTMVSVWFKEP